MEYYPHKIIHTIQLKKTDKFSVLEKMQYKLLEQIKCDIVNYFKSKNISSKYLDFLYRINKVSCFESGSQKFNGVIRGVEDSGLLIVETENEIIKFNTKEIKMLF